ncbi:MAG: hypothetical protein R2830_09650 [Saprospiraceae bacterium]
MAVSFSNLDNSSNSVDILTRIRLCIFLFSLLGKSGAVAFCYTGSPYPCSPVFHNHQQTLTVEEDTVKYRGYRLDLYAFEVLKKTDDWIKVKCTIVNSGRQNVNLGKEGTEHWVQMNFDQSLFDQKLGGFRENIRYALAAEKFKLDAGKMVRSYELKFSTTPPMKPREEPPPVFSGSQDPPKPSDSIAAKGGGDETVTEEDFTLKKKEACPDIYFADLRILEQDEKWATVEYTVTNQGKGIFHVYGEKEGQEDNLAVRAYISGVPVLSRGAMPIGGQIIQEDGRSGDLLPGESYTGTLKLDVRKKTRYLKSLILSLESYQFAEECDKTNNTGAVVLD